MNKNPKQETIYRNYEKIQNDPKQRNPIVKSLIWLKFQIIIGKNIEKKKAEVHSFYRSLQNPK